MNSATIIREYLKRRSETEDDLGRYPFVTISRQAGCASLAIANEVVRQAGGKLHGDMAAAWEVFDQHLCEFLADDRKLSGSLHDMLTEEYRSEVQQFIFDMVAGTSRQYAAYKRVFECVRALAFLGKAVIVGRGGAHVTADLPLGVHVRLVGGVETRTRNLARAMNIDEKKAAKKLVELDKGRARLVRDFFDKDIQDPLLYHAVFNIDALTPVEIAAQIVEMVEARIRRFNA